MKITRTFAPITITFETEEEVEQFKAVLRRACALTHPRERDDAQEWAWHLSQKFDRAG